MGITSALVTALSGLATSQSQIDVVGNNIANVNTVGFKSSNLDFKTQFLENFSFGTAPNGNQGGTNPVQIGLGATAGAISRDFSDGSLEATGVDTNLAIQGDGFFVLKDGTSQVYTRDGSFQLNGLNQLVSGTGQLVQGYGVDSNFNIVNGVLGNVTIPLGSLTVAQATQNVTMIGSLDANGALPTAVSQLTLGQDLYLTNGAGGVSATPPDATTPLTSLTDASGNPLFQSGDVINLGGTKGTNTVATQNFPITATTTLGDLISFTQGTLGINTTAGVNGSLTAPGVSIAADPAVPAGNAMQLNIDGNPGTTNDITLDPNSLTITRGGTTLTPFTWTKTGTANGESVVTTIPAYDSLGTPINVNVTAVLQSKTNTGSTWQIFAESNGGTATGANVQTAVGEGTLSFDNNGALISTNEPTVTINRSNTGATPNLTFNLDFSGTNALSGTSTGSTSNGSTLNYNTEDGSAQGTLESFTIGSDGVISGSFTNGLSRNLGQIALATFRNDEGLIDAGNNTFQEGPNSGNAIITTPTQQGAGEVVAGSLELSNVDLSSEFVKLISASTGFSASSRVITTADQLLQSLLSSVQG